MSGKGITLQIGKGRGWMEEVPQAVFLYLHPIQSEAERRDRAARDQEEGAITHNGMVPSRHGYLFSFAGLLKRPGERVSINICSGCKPASPDHLRFQRDEPVAVRQAAPYALLYLLWHINHGRLTEPLHLYVQGEVFMVLSDGIARGFQGNYLYPRLRKILLRLLDRATIVLHNLDEEELTSFRTKWYTMTMEQCVNMEHMFWKEWKEVPPVEWQGGKKGITPHNKMRRCTEDGKVVRK